MSVATTRACAEVRTRYTCNSESSPLASKPSKAYATPHITSVLVCRSRCRANTEPRPRDTAVPPSSAIPLPSLTEKSLKTSFKRSSLPSLSQSLCRHFATPSRCSPLCPFITPHVVTRHANRQRRSHTRFPPRALTLLARLTATAASSDVSLSSTGA